MNYSTYRFTLNMHSQRSQAYIKVFKGDTAVKLIMTLSDGGNLYKIGRGCEACGCAAYLAFRKPNIEEPIVHSCDIDGDCIIYTFDGTTADTVGVFECELTLVDDNGRVITAPKLVLDVAEKDVENDEDFPEFDENSKAIATVLGAVAKEDNREYQESIRQANEEQRQEAELARQANEEQRQESYNNAETTANEAKTTSQEAKNIAESAVTTASEAKETVDVFGGDIEALDERLEAYYDTFARATLTYDKEKSQMVYSFEGQDGYEEKRRADLPIKDLERRLDQLESATLQFTEDSSIAYEKIVPANSAKYALVNKVGGMTYKNNINNYLTLLRVDYNDTSAEVTINADNSITINKQDDDSGWVTIVYLPKDNIVEGRYFTSLNMPDYTSGISNISIASHYEAFDEYGGLQDGERTNELNSWIPKGDYYRNEISTISFYLGDSPMTETFSLILTDTDDLWQGLRDTKVTELVSEGANLIPPCIRKNVTNNGITYTVLDDGTVIANGTATAQSNFAFQEMWRGEKITLTQGETYTLSGEPNGASADTYRLMMQNASYSQNYYCGVPAVAKYTEYYAFIRIQQGIAVSNLVFKPMLNRGSTAKPYSPFGTIVDTFPIPEIEGVTDSNGNKVEGVGRGVNAEYHNYIDFERKVFAQKVSEVDMGLLNWGLRVSNNRYIFNASLSAYGIQGQISPDIPINALAEDYRAVTVNATWVDRDMAYNSKTLGNQTIEIVDNRYTNQTDFKAAVSGKKLLFAVETPIEIDISAYLTDDNFIEVEAGGMIKAVNEYEFDAPTTISYVSQKGS